MYQFVLLNLSSLDLLPAAFLRNGESTVFTGVCLLTFPSSGCPILPNWGHTPSFSMGGYPHPKSGWWAHPFQVRVGRFPPYQIKAGGTPISGQGERKTWVPHPPIQVSSQVRTGGGYPNRNMLRGGWYASCVHARALSCYYVFCSLRQLPT